MKHSLFGGDIILDNLMKFTKKLLEIIIWLSKISAHKINIQYQLCFYAIVINVINKTIHS